jgi:hypothetical protein
MASNVTARRSPIDRFFRNPETGDVVIVQFPNLQLWIFFIASAARMVLHPHGTVGMAVSVAAGLALVWWSADEVVRGDSLFRRVLGAVVLAAFVIRLVTAAFM